MGVNPSTAPKMANPMIDAMTDGIRASTSKSLRYRISAPRTAPPNGARKIAPIPDPMPTATAIRASAGVRSS